MKRTAVIMLLALLFAGISCDTSETTAIKVSTGSLSRAGTPPSEVAYVQIVAYRNSIASGQMVTGTVISAGSTGTLVVPVGTNLEILAVGLTSQRELAAWYGNGLYEPDKEPEEGSPPANYVIISMQKMIFEFPLATGGSVEYATDGPLPSFRVNWNALYDATTFAEGFTAQFLGMNLFKVMIERGFPTSDDMQPIGFADPADEKFDDYEPFSSGNQNQDHYYTIRMTIPSLGLSSPAPDPVAYSVP